MKYIRIITLLFTIIVILLILLHIVSAQQLKNKIISTIKQEYYAKKIIKDYSKIDIFYNKMIYQRDDSEYSYCVLILKTNSDNVLFENLYGLDENKHSVIQSLLADDPDFTRIKNIVKKSNITIFSTSREDKIEFPYIIKNNHRTFFLYRYFKEKNNVNFNQDRERNLRYALQLQQLQSTGSTVYLQHVHPL